MNKRSDWLSRRQQPREEEGDETRTSLSPPETQTSHIPQGYAAQCGYLPPSLGAAPVGCAIPGMVRYKLVNSSILEFSFPP